MVNNLIGIKKVNSFQCDVCNKCFDSVDVLYLFVMVDLEVCFAFFFYFPERTRERRKKIDKS